MNGKFVTVVLLCVASVISGVWSYRRVGEGATVAQIEQQSRENHNLIKKAATRQRRQMETLMQSLLGPPPEGGWEHFQSSLAQASDEARHREHEGIATQLTELRAWCAKRQPGGEGRP